MLHRLHVLLPLAAVCAFAPAARAALTPEKLRTEYLGNPLGLDATSPRLSWIVTSARAHYDSIRGRIASAWTRKDGAFELAVTIPANTTATVALPATDAAKLREGGRALAEATGVKLLRLENGRAFLEIGSGDYAFRVEP